MHRITSFIVLLFLPHGTAFVTSHVSSSPSKAASSSALFSDWGSDPYYSWSGIGGPRVQGFGAIVAPDAILTKQPINGGQMRSIGDVFQWVQGLSLETWTFPSLNTERILVQLKTDGRPLTAHVEMWHGPDNTVQKVDAYVEDGALRTFQIVMEAPQGSNTVAVRNTGHVEFPLHARVEDADFGGMGKVARNLKLWPKNGRLIQGQSVHTYPFANNVDSVQVYLKTDGRPLTARVELLNGPNNNKQVMEVYSENGYERPLYTVIDTPGTGNVIRVVNTATVEFPMTASVDAYEINNYYQEDNAADAGYGTGSQLPSW